MYQEITTKQLETLIESWTEIELIDVREKNEWDMIRIQNAKLIPLSTIQSRIEEIDFSKSVYIFCRTGWRSGQVCDWLETQGKTATNIAGSIKKLYETSSKILEITPKFDESYLK